MAELIPAYFKEFVNTGEERLVLYLQANLPDNYYLLPNIELAATNPRNNITQFWEYDLLVLTPHAIFCIENKDWRGRLEGDNNYWYLNDRQKANPLKLGRQKTAILHSKLAQENPDWSKVWVQNMVTLSHPVQNKSGLAQEALKLTFLLNNQLIDFITNPEKLGQRENGILPWHDKIIAYLSGSQSIKKPEEKKELLGQYEIIEILNKEVNYTEYLVKIKGVTSSIRKRIKEYALESNGDEQSKNRIRNQFIALNKIKGKSFILNVEFFNDDENHLFYEITDFYDENTLRAELKLKTYTNEQRLTIISDLMAALKSAHDEGVYHREINPENIYIISGHAYLSNFGKAWFTDHNGMGYTVASTITAANITPYHALELLSKEASRASDIYSLGVLIYELFLGEVPVTSSLELNKLGGRLPEDRLPTSKNPALPKWLDELCNKTILCDEFERFDNLAEMESFIKENLKEQSTTPEKEKEKVQEDSLEYNIGDKVGFKGKQSIINHGEALRNLINPEYNVSEEAEAFSQPSLNRLFPKLRFSINNIEEYLGNPSRFAAHLSFLINPFPTRSELINVRNPKINFYLNGLITTPSIYVEESEKEISWKKFIFPNKLNSPLNDFSDKGIQLFGNLQSFIAGALSTQSTDSIPSTELILSEKDKVLISLLHDHSDWVITFDKNLGPEIFDQPSKDGHIPFLLDYIPGEEISGVSSFLTTRPTSEVLGLLAPHFEEFDLNVSDKNDEEKIKTLLEDLRAISSSLVLQLNSSKNKAFEVIGAAFTKRVLEKKRILTDAFLIPIDLHQNLFENLSNENKSRADNLLVRIDTQSRTIEINVIEVKCRKSLAESEKIDLKEKIKKQIENTIQALQYHFDPQYSLSHDRLDRKIKNKELKALLEFYIDRANRYKYLDDQIHQNYLDFLQTLDSGFQLTFKQLGLIYDFSASQRHKKEVIDSELTFFIFGYDLIREILDPNSDLNTKRLENEDLETELNSQFGSKSISSLVQQIGNSGDVGYPVVEKVFSESPDLKQVAEKLHPIAEGDGDIKTGDKDIKSDIKDSSDNVKPAFDIMIGKSGDSPQYGLIGKSIHGKTLGMDLSETNTVSLFGVQGGGKSYSIGIVSEMVLKQVKNLNLLPSPLAGVIFHYSESMDYEPEFTSMIYPNDKFSEVQKLKQEYGVDPDRIEDIVILAPKDKVEERTAKYPSIPVLPIAFNSSELNVQDWLFLLGAIGNDSTYIKQLRAIMKENRNNLSVEALHTSVENSALLSNVQKALARQRLLFAQEYIDDSFNLKEILKPGRLILVDLRDEFIEKDQALGLFVIMLNIFSSVKTPKDEHFNKFIVFDEAHKYMDNKELTSSIVTAIREMRHKGVSIMIASQDPPSLPNEIIELSSIVIVHKFNSPQWLKHIQKSITQLNALTPAEMFALQPGECFIWTTKANDKTITTRPLKMYTRPRFTKHGGGTINAL